ncbi:MAG: threonine/serine exporter family protein [Corynebacterium sp.]|nr:threonine/serine exporter family protein [Corynebacterium sp.]
MTDIPTPLLNPDSATVKENRRPATSRLATIDEAGTPPLAPLAPNHFESRGEISGVLNIAARIGEILINAGVTNTDAAIYVRSVLESFGLWGVHVDLTHQRINLYANIPGEHGINMVHVVRGGAQNYRQLAQCDALIRDIHAGKAGPAAAEIRLDSIAAYDKDMEDFGVKLSWSVLGAAVSAMIGGSIYVILVTWVASLLIMHLTYWLDKKGLPVFFQNAAGGVLATFIAGVTYRIGMEFDVLIRPSMIIATSIVVMLAGLTLVQALQNGVASAPITAMARLFDTLMVTAGVVAGVGMGIMLMSYLGISLPPMETTAAPNFNSNFVRVLGGTFASAGFARACQAQWPAVFSSMGTAFMASCLYYYVFLEVNMSDPMATALTATTMGLLAGLVGRRFQVPPVIIAVAGVTPLLPGLAIYRGLYGLLNDQILAGFTNLTFAFVTATALSAGIVFGEWIARQLRRPVRLQNTLRYYRRRARRRMRLEQRNEITATDPTGFPAIRPEQLPADQP